MNPKPLTLEKIQREVKRLDPKLHKNDNLFKTAVLMFSALRVGPSTKRLVEFTGYPTSFVEPRVQRLRKAKIFVRGKVRCAWFEKAGGEIAFWCDVLVAEGMLDRRENAA